MARSLVTGASLLSFPLRASGRNDRILREPATANGPTVLPRQYFRQCPGTRWYGNTKRGKYVGECAAIQDGNRPAYGKACGSNLPVGGSHGSFFLTFSQGNKRSRRADHPKHGGPGTRSP